jgi:phosphatidate cytidylyltransferase
MDQQLKQRIIMSTLGIVGLTSTIYFSFNPFFKPIFILLTAAVIGLALVEYYQLSQHCKFKPLIELGLSSAIAYIGTVGLSLYYPIFEAVPSLVLLFALVLFFLAFLRDQKAPVGNLAVTLFGIAYLVIPLSCVLRINYFFPENIGQDGRLWLAYVLTVTKMTDMGAYIVGKAFGKNKLAPSISPNKTIEGSLGGTFASLLASYLFYQFSSSSIAPPFHLTAWQALGLGITFSLLSQVGDLGESLLKREAGIKDSSRLPGLGGALDVVDSLIFTFPLMYLLLQMRIVG